MLSRLLPKFPTPGIPRIPSPMVPAARQGTSMRVRSSQLSSGIEVELECGFRASFPATGSGMLWARSTGLKLSCTLRVGGAICREERMEAFFHQRASMSGTPKGPEGCGACSSSAESHNLHLVPEIASQDGVGAILRQNKPPACRCGMGPKCSASYF